MTKAQEQLRKQLLAKIHMHPKHKALKEAGAWGDFLYYRFKVESSANLSIDELLKLLDLLEGRIVDWEDASEDSKGRRALLGDFATQKQLRHIYHLREELGWSETTLMRFVKRQIGEYKLFIQDCTKKEAQKIINGLRAVLSQDRRGIWNE